MVSASCVLIENDLVGEVLIYTVDTPHTAESQIESASVTHFCRLAAWLAHTRFINQRHTTKLIFYSHTRQRQLLARSLRNHVEPETKPQKQQNPCVRSCYQFLYFVSGEQSRNFASRFSFFLFFSFLFL